MSILGNRILGGAGQQPYLVGRSLRFRSSASAYLNRTPATTSDRRIWTASIWAKIGTLGVTRNLLSAIGVSRVTYIYMGSGNQIGVYSATSAGGGDGGEYLSTQVFRDPSAWYHIVVAYDSTQATSTNRIKVYINGVQITAWSLSTAPTLNHDTQFNWTSAPMQLAAYNASQFFDGYMAEVNFIDGQQLTPSSFGAYDNNGVWQPRKYGGTYGTNGFYLPFSNTTSTTTLVQDSSGNGNNWTPNNISLTAGTTYDSMIDSPTVSASSSNYAVLNPIGVPYNTGTAAGGNLNWTGATTADKGMAAIISMDSGKWYWECTVTATAAGSNSYVGIVKTSGTADSNANRVFYRGDGAIVKYGTTTTGLTSYTTNDVIGVAYDYSAQTLAFYKNNTLVTTVTGINLEPNLPWVGGYTTTESWSVNFGQRPFSYTPPTGFSALNTYNLPQPTIMNGAKYMAATLWTGDGANPRTITNTVNNAAFQPDLVWTKARNQAYDNSLYDSIRGATNYLISNSTAAEASAANSLQAFNSNGFQVGGNNYTNSGSVTYVGWQWNAGSGVTSTNTNGSISSLVSVNPTAGFSIVSYTGTGVNATVGHGLGVVPNMVIIKNRTVGTENWAVYHTSTGAGNWLLLSGTNAAIANTTIWQNTTPTSSVISLGPISNSNVAGSSFIGYFWSAVAGYSAFGSYTGNGSSDGPFVYTGFRPRWVMIKNITTGGANYDWVLIDSSREPYNVTQNDLAANTSASEASGILSQPNDFLSNGFKIRASGVNAYPTNASGSTYIYAAFAENPFKISRAR